MMPCNTSANCGISSDGDMPDCSSFAGAHLVHCNAGDALRPFLMHAFGGLYIDLDVQCFRSVEESLLGQDIVLQSEYKGGHDVVNSIMASVPGHPFWKAIITEMLEVSSHYQPPLDAFCICGLHADYTAV